MKKITSYPINANNKYIVLLLLLLCTIRITYSQNITGTVTDSIHQPIEGVVVIMQSINSDYIDAITTDEEGKFFFNNNNDKGLILLFQHMSYHPFEKRIDQGVSDAGHTILSEKGNALDEIVITAEQPLLKIKGNTLSYNTKQIIEKKAVSNAFEVIKEIPGVIGSNDEIKLLGASQVSIVIDGKVSTLSSEQFNEILKTIPATNIKNVEILYNAPAKYNVKGAIINVVTSNETKEKKIVGEVSAMMSQAYYLGGGLRGNLSYNNKKFRLDFIGSYIKDKQRTESDVYSKHHIGKTNTAIDQNTILKSDNDKITFRLSGDYMFDNKDRLSASYYLNNNDIVSKNTADSKYIENNTYSIYSNNNKDGKRLLQNIHIEYLSHLNYTIGVDYTYFNDESNEKYIDFKDNSVNNDFLYNSEQRINKWSVFSNYEGEISENWSWNIGTNLGYNKSKTFVEYLLKDGSGYYEDPDKRLDNIQDEYTGNFYIESDKKIGEKLNVNLSLQFEYFNSKYNNNGDKTTLWNEWTFFPNFSINYTFTEKNALNLTLSSNKKYPSYWAINPQTAYVNSYMEIIGNPQLKPSNKYEIELMNILNKKYQILGFATYVPDYFVQMPYQDDEKLKITYRYENFDYDLKFGIGGVVPFKIKDFWTSEITVYGMKMRQKMNNFHGSRFDRKKYVVAAFFNNSFLLSRANPRLLLQLNGRYQSKAIQGVYDLGNSYELSSNLKWTISNRANLTLGYKNIFRNNKPNPTIIDWGTQYSKRKNHEFSSLDLTFTWRFGNYKTKRYNNIDQSRFSR